MKKKILFILALAVLFSACKMKLSENIGTVVIDFGSNERAVDSKGLPVLKDASMRLEINSPSQGTQKIDFATGKEKKWSGSFPIGEKLTIKVAVKTAAAEWTGSAEHTVTEGTNTVAVKLSKAPKSVGNILIEVDDSGDSCTLKMESGKVLVSKAWINTHHGTYPITARDKIGRIYVLYKEGSFGSATPHFKRYDTEGNEDNGFEAAITGKLPSGVTLNQIKTMTVDAKTGTIFIVGMDASGAEHAYAVTERGHNNFTLSNGFDLTSVIGSGSTIQTAAAYNGTLFFTVPSASSGAHGRQNKLVAVKAELSGPALTLTKKDEKTLPKLRIAGAFGNYPTNCTGLFADADGVYCLLSDQNLYGGTLYALGQIVRYQYSGSAFTGETKVGLNPAASIADPIAFNAQYFSNPVGFIGYDEENIYIADDGVDITEVNENLHVNGNKNRIAAFNRKTNGITFSNTDATWYAEHSGYKFPETKMLLWEKGGPYWVGDNGTEAYSPSSALSTMPSQQLTDVFCYDQDGNLYVVVQEGSSYKVKRFTPTDSGFNSTGDMKIKNESERPVSIAVDVSGGTNILYYGINVVPVVGNLRLSVQKIEWQGSFDGEKEPQAFTSAENEAITALAANKDAVFVGVKQKYEETVGVNQISKYRLKVKKFLKGAHADGSVTIVEKIPLYVDPVNPDTPIPNPQPYDNSQLPYIEYEEAINGLQVVEGTLYAITSKAKKLMKYNNDANTCTIDEFKMSSALYKIGKTEEGFSGNADKLAEKKPVPPVGSNPGVGYGFYRFIAVKPKKLVIASDGAYDVNGHLSGSSSNPVHNDNKVLIYDLDGNLNTPEETDAAGKFTKELQPGSGFSWE